MEHVAAFEIEATVANVEHMKRRRSTSGFVSRLPEVNEKAYTPTLILQGELDERCPKRQAEELFVTMRVNCEAPCELVIYPGGSHSFLGAESRRIESTRSVASPSG